MRTPSLRNDGAVLLAALLLATVLPLALGAQQLQPRLDGGRLYVSAPGLHFLTGKVLDRLRNGAAVAFHIEPRILLDGSVPRRVGERFVISYDLWEERFSVTRLARDGMEPLSVSHLSREAAETWCLDKVWVATEGLDADRPVRIGLEVRAEEPRDAGPLLGDDGISLGAIVDIFSRRTREEQQTWSLEAGPLRLSDIRPKVPE